jgi:hypothetical protein
MKLIRFVFNSVQFLVLLGYSFNALPYNYLDTPPNDLTSAKRNLEILTSILTPPIDSVSSDPSHSWPKMTAFIRRTREEVYAVLNQLLHSMETVMTLPFEENGSVTFSLSLGLFILLNFIRRLYSDFRIAKGNFIERHSVHRNNEKYGR